MIRKLQKADINRVANIQKDYLMAWQQKQPKDV